MKESEKEFVENKLIPILEKHFITQEMVDLYKQNRISDFLLKREEYIKLRERKFVEDLEIRYSE